MRPLVLVLSLLVTRLSLACTQPSFEGAPTIPLAGAGSHVVADMNRDGIPDLLVSASPSLSERDVVVLFGNGDGTFRVVQNVRLTPGGSGDLASGDFNGDGFPDAAIYHTSRISILLGKSDGTLGAPTDISVTGNAYPMEAADITGDGKLDLVWAGQSDNKIDSLPGNGDGTFGAETSIAIGSGAFSLTVGDFDGDGRPDLAGGAYNDKTLTIASTDHTIFTTATAFEPSVLASADFDGNGKLDLLVAGASNTVTLFLNDGGGTFHTRDITLTGPFAGFVLAADFNGDGLADFSIDTLEDGSYWTSSFLNNGDGTFRRVGRMAAPFTRAVGDFNGDGILDMTGNESGHVAFYRGRSDGTFVAAKAIPVDYKPVDQGKPDVHSVQSGDFDGDGRIDLAVASNSASDITFLYANGTSSVLHLATPPFAPAASDLDGNGLPDLIVAHSTSFDVLLNHGGTFASPVTYTTPGTGPFAIGDLNGDGHPDVVVVTLNDASIFLGSSSGTFASPLTATIAAQKPPSAIDIGDFDGDGKADLVTGAYRFQAPDTTVAFVKGHGDGTFDAPRYLALSDDINSILAFDANRDGKLDIVMGVRDGMVLQLGNGNGTFRDPVHLPMGRDIYGITAGDWNGDGIPDLAANGSSNDIVFILGHGDGTFGDVVSYEAGASPRSFALGDFNGDGRIDVAVGNSEPGAETVTLLYNDCTTRRRTSRH